MGKRVTNATAAAVSAIESAAADHPGAMPPEFPRLLYGRAVAEDLGHERDEFIQQLTRLLRPDVAAPDVQDKVLFTFTLGVELGCWIGGVGILLIGLIGLLTDQAFRWLGRRVPVSG